MRSITLAFVILVAATATNAAETVTEKIPLRHVKPSEMVSQFLSATASSPKDETTPGSENALFSKEIASMSPDDPAGVLTVQGTPDAVAGVKSRVKQLDFAPHSVQFRVRLQRQRLSGDTVVESADIAGIEAGGASMRSLPLLFWDGERRLSVEIVPRANGDGSVTTRSHLTLPTAGAAKTSTISTYRRSNPGQEISGPALTDATDERVRQWVQQHSAASAADAAQPRSALPFPVPGARHTVYRLFVTVLSIAPPAGDHRQGDR